MAHISVARIKELFRRYDPDLDGSIAREDLKAILQSLSIDCSKAELNAIIRAVDKNRDGRIQYDEFVDVIFFGSKGSETTSKVKTRHEFPEEDAKALWYFWQLLQPETVPGGTVPRDEVLEALSPGSYYISEAEKMLIAGGSDGKDVLYRLSSVAVTSRVERCPEMVTQDDLIRAVWPKLNANGFETVQRLMRKFLAQRGMMNLFQAVSENDKGKCDLSNVRFLFQEIDVNNDGCISIQEMVKLGNLEKDQALTLSEALDTTQEDGQISLEELSKFLVKIDGRFEDSMKALFAFRGCKDRVDFLR